MAHTLPAHGALQLVDGACVCMHIATSESAVKHLWARLALARTTARPRLPHTGYMRLIERLAGEIARLTRALPMSRMGSIKGNTNTQGVADSPGDA